MRAVSIYAQCLGELMPGLFSPYGIKRYVPPGRYLSEPAGERKASITSERPDLPRCGCNLAEACRDQHDDDDQCHHVCGSVAAGGVEEALDEGYSDWRGKQFLGVSHREDESDTNDQHEGRIDPHTCKAKRSRLAYGSALWRE